MGSLKAGQVAVPGRSPVENASREKPRLRVLVVEDNPATRQLLVFILRRDYDVVAASGVDEALGLVQEQVFDGLVLDINLCEQRSGVDLLHAVRAMPRYRSIPAVACTAYTDRRDRAYLLSEGFDVYVPKPFTKEDIYEALNGLFKAGDGQPGAVATVMRERDPSRTG